MATTSSVACGAEVIVARRCPECELEATLVTSVVRAAIWFRQDTRTMAGLMRLADSLRDARALAVVGPTGSADASHM